MREHRDRKKIQQLAGRLQNTGGKKVYGYLKADVKALVDQIVDELVKDSRVAALYSAWGKWQNEIMKTYTGKLPQLPPLSSQAQFKSIKNMVITEALNIGGHHFTFGNGMPSASYTSAVTIFPVTVKRPFRCWRHPQHRAMSHSPKPEHGEHHGAPNRPPMRPMGAMPLTGSMFSKAPAKSVSPQQQEGGERF